MSASNNTHTNSVDLSWLEQYRQISVIGLGMSGVGVTKMLSSRGVKLHVQDSRDNVVGLDEIRALENVQSVHLGSFDLARILTSDLLIMSPGISLQTSEIQQAIKNGIEISSDVDIVTRSCSVPIIAITGSNGKSTVTQLTGEICQAAGYDTFIGGNIGRSVMELIDENRHYDLAVLELSSFQLEITPNLNALSAAVLNLSPDHLDRYDSYQDYAMSKLSIYNDAKNYIWNRDDSWFDNVELFAANQDNSNVKNNLKNNAKASIKKLSFGLQSPRNNNEFGILEDEYKKTFFAQGQLKICPTDVCKLIGTHNHLNVLAAMALLSTFDISSEIMQTAISRFEGLKHRMQKIREHDGVVWINDSKATNVGATESAILGLQGSIVLIAGGQGKGAEFADLIPVLKKHVTRTYVFGEDAQKMNTVWEHELDVQVVTSLEDAVLQANQFAQQGDIVLFAPACASFDMFTSFEARGDSFVELVNGL